MCTEVIDEFDDSWNLLSQTKLYALICHIQLKLQPLCVFLTILAKIWLLWQSPLDSWNQKCLLLFGRPPNLCHRTKNVNNSRNYANTKVRDQFTITGIGNFQYFCTKYVKLLKQFYLNPKGPTLHESTYCQPLATLLRPTLRPVQVSKDILIYSDR